MAGNRKYAALPDLDLAPDIYETPELTDDASTIPAQSETSPNDIEDEDGGSGINRLRLDPDAARSQFLSTRVDAREADFSDRLDSKRKSYRVSSRRRKPEDGDEGIEDSSDEDDTSPDGLRRRIARLQQEAEELKADVEWQRQTQGEIGGESQDALNASSLDQLSGAIKMLKSMNAAGGPQSAEARLALRLGSAAKAQPSTTNSAPTTTAGQSTYTLAYNPEFSQSHALSLAAAFDSRLSRIESAIGIQALPLPSQSISTHRPLLPALETLERQLNALATATPASLELVGKRVRQLTMEAEALDERRRAAKQSYDEMRSAASEPYPNKTGPSLSVIEDAEVESKISALYGTLPTIESIAPLLPLVLERLRSLRLIHADAAGAAERLEEAEKSTVDMEEEIRRWREGLEVLEKKLGEGEEGMRKNLGMVELWVKELEERADELMNKS